jgi:hypothetical protein
MAWILIGAPRGLTNQKTPAAKAAPANCCGLLTTTHEIAIGCHRRVKLIASYHGGPAPHASGGHASAIDKSHQGVSPRH